MFSPELSGSGIARANQRQRSRSDAGSDEFAVKSHLKMLRRPQRHRHDRQHRVGLARKWEMAAETAP